jgi:cysteine desulfurase
MGRTEREANGCIRMTLGKDSTDSDVDAVLEALPKALDGALRAGLTS